MAAAPAHPRLAMSARVLAGVAGGYGLAALASAALAVALPGPPLEATLWATMAASLVFVAALLASFAARSALRAWAGLLLAAAPLAALLLLQGGRA